MSSSEGFKVTTVPHGELPKSVSSSPLEGLAGPLVTVLRNLSPDAFAVVDSRIFNTHDVLPYDLQSVADETIANRIFSAMNNFLQLDASAQVSPEGKAAARRIADMIKG